VPFVVELEQDEDTEVTRAIAYIYPTPYATMTASNRVKENEGVKEWSQ
jgi:hypothetical protein